MDAIILAGGKGTRLNGIISDVPKPLAPINGKPFLDILLTQLNRFACIKKVVLAVGYKSEMIVNRYKNSPVYNFRILFSEEKDLLGTGGAIKKAIALTNTDDVIALNGDSFIEIDIEDLIQFHRINNSSLTVVLKEVNNIGRYGSIELDSKRRILNFREKSGAAGKGLINAGVYVIKRTLFDTIEEDKKLSVEKEIMPALIRQNAYGYVVKGRFIDIGTPESYRAASEYFKEGS